MLARHTLRRCALAPGVRCFASTTLSSVCNAALKEMKEAGTHKRERVITSTQSAHITVSTSPKPVLNLCANNYLGLSSHPAVVAAAHAALDTHGFGLSSVRFICGTQDLHKELERRIAAFHGMEDCILFPSCFDANAGIFEALLSAEDAVISDEKNHASIIDGIRLCKAQRERYRHRDMGDLEDKLKATAGKRMRMIVTDGVFSMDGTVAPLPEIVALAAKYDASVFIDECHATGFFGPTGRGTDEHTGTFGKVDIINSTLGKALGGATGGYTASTREVVDVLRNKARPYLFSNSVAPAVVGASLKVFDMIEKDSSHCAKVKSLTHRFRRSMGALGFTLSGDFDHPICPVMLGDARMAAEFADEMLTKGVYVIGCVAGSGCCCVCGCLLAAIAPLPLTHQAPCARRPPLIPTTPPRTQIPPPPPLPLPRSFSYPVVPKGMARIRTQISAAHSEADIDFAVEAFKAVGIAKGVIKA
jgi:glycine C-acetyltransferase